MRRYPKPLLSSTKTATEVARQRKLLNAKWLKLTGGSRGFGSGLRDDTPPKWLPEEPRPSVGIATALLGGRTAVNRITAIVVSKQKR